MDEELFNLFDQAVARGEVKDEASANAWLQSRGFDTFGKKTAPGSPFGRGLMAAVPSQIFGTGERLSRAFDILTPGDMLGGVTQSLRQRALRPYETEAERVAVGTAPKMRLPLARDVQADESRAVSYTHLTLPTN